MYDYNNFEVRILQEVWHRIQILFKKNARDIFAFTRQYFSGKLMTVYFQHEINRLVQY